MVPQNSLITNFQLPSEISGAHCVVCQIILQTQIYFCYLGTFGTLDTCKIKVDLIVVMAETAKYRNKYLFCSTAQTGRK